MQVNCPNLTKPNILSFFLTFDQLFIQLCTFCSTAHPCGFRHELIFQEIKQPFFKTNSTEISNSRKNI